MRPAWKGSPWVTSPGIGRYCATNGVVLQMHSNEHFPDGRLGPVTGGL